MSRASVWAAMEGRGCGTDPVALLGWRLECLAQFYIPINSNIKCIDSTIKCIGFESFHYVINLDVISSFMVFSDFDYMFLSMYC